MRIVRWTLAALLLAGALSVEGPMATPLEAQECVAVTVEGEPRSCTATENLGQCLFEAVDSYHQCTDQYTEWWIGWVCEAYLMFDAAVCIVEAISPLK